MKFYQKLKQAARSMKNHGKHRRTSPPAHSGTPDGTDNSTRRTSADDARAGHFTVTFPLNPTPFAFVPSIYPDAPPEPKPVPPTVPYAGIRTGEIIGYRMWWLIDGRLCSIAHKRSWFPDEVMAGDLNEVVCTDGCANPIWGGVYSYKSADQGEYTYAVREHISLVGRSIAFDSYFEDMQFLSGLVVGTVKMWGDVIEHQTGYRAQFAKLNSIENIHLAWSTCNDGAPDDAKKQARRICDEICDRYGVRKIP